MTITKSTQTVCNAQEQRAALERMAEIEAIAPTAEPEEAVKLLAEYSALDGSWLHEVEMEIDTMSPAEAKAATAAEQAKEANQRTIEDQSAVFLAANTAYINIASPTNAQSAAQIKALSRQMNKVIRLMLRRFDGTE